MKNIHSLLTLGATVATVILGVSSAEAASPQFYPNAKYNNATVSQLQGDIQSCGAKAAQYAAPHEKSAIGTGVRTAAKGAALGALGGAITGNTGRGAGAGAAMGGVVGTARGVQNKGTGSPEFQNFTTICLEEKGYKIVGWR
jgi:outer membrane lipoprotein SlyB